MSKFDEFIDHYLAFIVITLAFLVALSACIIGIKSGRALNDFKESVISENEVEVSKRSIDMKFERSYFVTYDYVRDCYRVYVYCDNIFAFELECAYDYPIQD